MVKRIVNKLNKAESKYQGVIGSVEAEIADKVEFDFTIFYQPSDGFVMMAELQDDSKNAPIDKILEVIKNKGVLTEDDYLKFSI